MVIYVKDARYIKKHRSNLTNNEEIKLKKVNIIIGKNNSGKSRLMREILENNVREEQFFYWKAHSNPTNIKPYELLFKKLKNQLDKYFQKYQIELFSEFKETYICNPLEISAHYYCSIAEQEMLKKLLNNINIYIKLEQSTNKDKLLLNTLEIINECLDPNNYLFDRYRWTNPSYYVPTIRNIYFKGRQISNLFMDKYFENLKDLSNSKGKTFRVITGEDFIEDFKLDIKNNDPHIGTVKEMLKNILMVHSVDIKLDNDYVYFEIDGEIREISNLGDGIQNLLILTYYHDRGEKQANKQFIEEPEISLHPGLQRNFVKEILNNSNTQLFIATHSPHFLDLIYEPEYKDKIAIIKVEKEGPKTIAENIDVNFFNPCKLLDVRASSLFLSNCIIWIEGPTDPKYIDPVLKLYIKAYNKKELSVSCHYNYAYNGGINIAQYMNAKDSPEQTQENIKKITKNSMFIFDFDGRSNYYGEKGVRIKKFRDVLISNKEYKNNCYIMKNMYTIENAIPIKYLKEYYMKKGYSKKEKAIIIDFFDEYEKGIIKINISNNSISKEISDYVTKKLGKNKKSKLAVLGKTEFAEEFEVKINEILKNSKTKKELKKDFNSFDEKFKKMIIKIYDYIVFCNEL